ncbi:hypothetical protein OROHE_007191 [Orobanche hederae]
MLTSDIPPNQTIYIRNLNEKVKKEELKRSLYTLLSQYGRILDIVALKTANLRGQAWVVFSEVTAASSAVRQMQNFPFYDKPMGTHTDGMLSPFSSHLQELQWVAMREIGIFVQVSGNFVIVSPYPARRTVVAMGFTFSVVAFSPFLLSFNNSKLPLHQSKVNNERIQYAKSKSDCIAKAEGTYDKKKKQDEKAERKSRVGEGQQPGTGNGPRADTNGGPAAVSRPGKPGTQEAVTDPNNILFIQNLPHETNSMMLELLFKQYGGFREVRMVEAKPGIAFVEFENDERSSLAMRDLQGFKITSQNPMAITYAKK